MSEQLNPQPAARGTADLTPAEQLVRAVLDHRTVNLVYEGLRRVVEPHLVGLHQAGEPMVAAFQTGGRELFGDEAPEILGGAAQQARRDVLGEKIAGEDSQCGRPAMSRLRWA